MKIAETRFRETLRRERESRGWSQAHLARLLTARGLTIYPTTVAKIEAGERSARIDEMVAVADIIQVSLDALHDRRVEKAADKSLVLSALDEAGTSAVFQIQSIQAALSASAAALNTFPLEGREKTIYAESQKACDAMGDALAALQKAGVAMVQILRGRLSKAQQEADELDYPPGYHRRIADRVAERIEEQQEGDE